MRGFYDGVVESVDASVVTASPAGHTLAGESPLMSARVAVYDALTAPPRVEDVTAGSPGDLIERLTARTYHAAREAGGSIAFMVIREIVENFVHAGFDDVVVSVLDGGATLRFADQGPGIPDKERAFLPGFTTATGSMKRYIKGVGSGLPVARECLAFSGGTVEVDDNLGQGTVVTLRSTMPGDQPSVMDQVPLLEHEPPGGAASFEAPPLSTRQKQVLSLLMELGSIGPTVVSRELAVGLSTAYRDLEHLEGHGLITSDDSGKRVLTDQGLRCLDALFGR